MKKQLDHLQSSILCGLMTRQSYHIEHLSIDDFSGRNRIVFEAMQARHRNGEPFDAISLIDHFQSSEHLTLIMQHSPQACSDSLVSLINSLKVEQLKLGINKILTDEQNYTSSKILAAIDDLKTQSEAPSLEEVKDLTHEHQEFITHLETIRAQSSEYLGIQTLLPDLDSLASGLCPSHLVVIAARPSVGKSALGLFLIGQALLQKKNVLFYSTEMDNKTILGRLYSQVLRIPASNLTTFPKRLSDRDLEVLIKSKHELEHFFAEVKFGAHVHHVYNKAYVLKKRDQLDMLVVDYLQNLSGNGETPVEKLSYISNNLKKIAMDLEIPVIALAQLNRQAQHMEIPSMAEIKGSGTIEQDADLILLLHHNPHELEHEYWLICAKNRHGEIRDIPIIFDKQYQSFRQDPNPAKRFIGKKPKKDIL
jgi:replicative DNA helicase